MEQKSIFLILIGFALGFACAFPIGYSAGHKTSSKIYEQKIKKTDSASQNTIKAAVEATPAGQGRTVLEEYQRKNTWFELPSADGEGTINLENYKNQPVLLMFYTETCPYCRKAAPELEKIHKKYIQQGLQVLGLCAESEREAALRFASELGITFPMAYNAQTVSRRYGIQGVPFIYLLDKKHELSEVWPGFDQSYSVQIEKAVQKAI